MSLLTLCLYLYHQSTVAYWYAEDRGVWRDATAHLPTRLPPRLPQGAVRNA